MSPDVNMYLAMSATLKSMIDVPTEKPASTETAVEPESEKQIAFHP